MTQPRSPEHRQELAALHALHALDGDEAAAFARHLQDEGTEAQASRAEVAGFAQAVGELGHLTPPVAPPPQLRNHLFARLAKEPQQPIPGPESFVFLKAAQGRWVEVLPGMTVKVLFADPESGRTTSLVKMTAGTHYAAHRHAAAEEVYVLEGGCVCGGQSLLPGDYHRAAAGSVHVDTYTDDGCLLLVISSPRNEML